jgi:hypothetical protein
LIPSRIYGLETASTRERTKREKYQTSRPYEEKEKLELVRFAFQEVFVTIPSMQRASARALVVQIMASGPREQLLRGGKVKGPRRIVISECSNEDYEQAQLRRPVVVLMAEKYG